MFSSLPGSRRPAASGLTHLFLVLFFDFLGDAGRIIGCARDLRKH
jgi:hypothetical protein